MRPPRSPRPSDTSRRLGSLSAPPASSLRSTPEPPDSLPPPEATPHASIRFDPGRPGVRALAVVGLIAALVAGIFLWMSRPRPQPVPDTPPSLSAPPASPSSTPTPRVVVHVAGKVRRPGVVTLSSGSRVTDAIRAAGGVRPGAGTGPLNLARRLVDGEQLLIGMRATPPPTAAAPAASTPAPGTPLDLNSATVDQFDGLPGVGPVLAQRIVDYRSQHGGFRTVEQLQDVSGIGARRYADLKPLVRV